MFGTRLSPTFTRGKRFVPHRLPVVAHDAGDGVSADGHVTVVTGVGDLRPQLVVVTRPAGVHDVARVKAGLSRFL